MQIYLSEMEKTESSAFNDKVTTAASLLNEEAQTSGQEDKQKEEEVSY